MTARFEWDPEKDLENQRKHKVTFAKAQLAFLDPDRVIAADGAHSAGEVRYFCMGRVGAGYWRKGKRIYEQENSL